MKEIETVVVDKKSLTTEQNQYEKHFPEVSPCQDSDEKNTNRQLSHGNVLNN